MRQSNTNGRRARGRPNRKPHGHHRGQNFDSSGPEGRIRGNASQVYEKYLALARDASSGGDRVAAEAYYQHAEHYFRILNDSTDPETEQSAGQRQGGHGGRDYNGQGRGDGRQRFREPEPQAGTAPINAQSTPEQAGPAQPEPAAAIPGTEPQPVIEDPVVGAPPAATAELPPGEAEKPRRGRPRKTRDGAAGDGGAGGDGAMPRQPRRRSAKDKPAAQDEGAAADRPAKDAGAGEEQPDSKSDGLPS